MMFVSPARQRARAKTAERRQQSEDVSEQYIRAALLKYVGDTKRQDKRRESHDRAHDMVSS